MGFFDRLFGGGNADDPTTAWAAAKGPSPQVSFDRRTLGTSFAQLPFGGDVSEAVFLGRADAFSGNAQHFTLAYDQWGLEVSFESRRLAEVGFQIGQEALAPRAAVVPATPTGPDGVALTASTTEANLLARVGAPASRQTSRTNRFSTTTSARSSASFG
jgi:hypothetical protein